MPEIWKFNIIEISPILGGLVLAAAGLFGEYGKKQFVKVAQKFIASTIFLIFSVVFVYNANFNAIVDQTQKSIQYHSCPN
jgi:hypothetical protein